MCFNAKNKRYAIANVEVGKEKYLEFKKKFTKWLADSLDMKKDLNYDIFSIGAGNQ